MFDRIVVALDGSATGEQALPVAEDLARRLGVPLHLLRVADLTRLRIGATEVALEYARLSKEMDEEERKAHRYLDDLAARLRTDGLPVTTEVRSGLAPREILAAVRPGDLLTMTSHGRGGPARFFLGSVAEEVARHAPVPVLLVRASATAS